MVEVNQPVRPLTPPGERGYHYIIDGKVVPLVGKELAIVARMADDRYNNKLFKTPGFPEGAPIMFDKNHLEKFSTAWIDLLELNWNRHNQPPEKLTLPEEMVRQMLESWHVECLGGVTFRQFYDEEIDIKLGVYKLYGPRKDLPSQCVPASASQCSFHEYHVGSGKESFQYVIPEESEDGPFRHVITIDLFRKNDASAAAGNLWNDLEDDKGRISKKAVLFWYTAEILRVAEVEGENMLVRDASEQEVLVVEASEPKDIDHGSNPGNEEPEKGRGRKRYRRPLQGPQGRRELDLAASASGTPHSSDLSSRYFPAERIEELHHRVLESQE